MRSHLCGSRGEAALRKLAGGAEVDGDCVQQRQQVLQHAAHDEHVPRQPLQLRRAQRRPRPRRVHAQVQRALRVSLLQQLRVELLLQLKLLQQARLLLLRNRVERRLRRRRKADLRPARLRPARLRPTRLRPAAARRGAAALRAMAGS